MGCLPYRLHWFFPGEGCWGRREEAVTLTPGSVVWGAWIVKLKHYYSYFLPGLTVECTQGLFAKLGHQEGDVFFFHYYFLRLVLFLRGILSSMGCTLRLEFDESQGPN